MITIYAFYLMVLFFIVGGAYAAYRLIEARAAIHALRLELANVNTANPWKTQLMLMLKSGQAVPNSPTITKTSMLYGALILEEAAETLIGLAKGIEQVSMGRGSDLHAVSVSYVHIAKIMSVTALTLRNDIATTPEHPKQKLISQEVANEILDGTTDLHVVTAGLSIACGLPGQAAYDRVGASNLSKANPITGVIDKDDSGKWIKGGNYHAPDIDSLLAPYYAVEGQ